MKKESYKELKAYVSDRTGFSRHKTRRIVKEFSTVNQDFIKRGDTIRIEGILTISYKTKEGDIYNNKVATLTDQIEEIASRLELDKMEVRAVITTYLMRIIERVQDGYQVNIKGICYIIPIEKGEYLYGSARVSPVLKKPESADFVVFNDLGSVDLMEVDESKLRFSIEIDEDLQYLN